MNEKDLFLPSGFLDVRAIRDSAPQAAFFLLLGSRRVGKTWGIVDMLHEEQKPYVFCRNTKEELQHTISGSVDFFRENAFPWAADMTIKDGKPLYMYDINYEDGQLPVGMALALHDVAKIRGYGGSRFDNLLLDEFIPEQGAYCPPDLGTALKNAYMTINGVRELPAGGSRPPLRCWLTANSNNLNSDILAAFNLTAKVLDMQRQHQHYSYMPERRCCIVLIDNISPISQQLQRSALMQCIGQEDDFTRMAINNIFVNDDQSGVCSRPIKEYLPRCQIDGYTFYQHKSRPEWYIVQGGQRCKYRYNSKNPTQYRAFLQSWRWYGLAQPVDGRNIFYNCYTAKLAAYKLLRLDKKI